MNDNRYNKDQTPILFIQKITALNAAVPVKYGAPVYSILPPKTPTTPSSPFIIVNKVNNLFIILFGIFKP